MDGGTPVPQGFFANAKKHKNVRNVFGPPWAGHEVTFYRDVKCKKSSIKLDYLVPRGGLEPPRREALTPEASVSTNSTTEAYAADAVHIMRQWQSRQLLNAKNLAKAV